MIYTFYSYKGGVGRSMALANIAECFYLQGLRVLMIDWDLEAPGLESFFFQPDPDEKSEPDEDTEPTLRSDAVQTAQDVEAITRESVAKLEDQARRPRVSLEGTSATRELRKPLQGLALVRSNLGVIDMVTEYKRSFTTIVPDQPRSELSFVPKAFQKAMREEQFGTNSDPGDFARALDEHLPKLATYLFAIHTSTGNNISPNQRPPSLHLLPAGWRHKRFRQYGQAVQSFDWDEFYGSYRAKQYFEWLRTKLLDAADVVLIDSRTGVTEMGGVCVRQLADFVISFSAPNHQNVEGIARMNRSFTRKETIDARDGRGLQIVVVPTRVDPQELDDLRQFRIRFDTLVSESTKLPDAFQELNLNFWDLQIPYRTKYSYQERRVIGPDVTSVDETRGLENAYWKLAAHLALLAPETHLIRQRFATRLQQQFPSLPSVLLSYMPDARAEGAHVRELLKNAGVRTWPDLDHVDSASLSNSTSRIAQTRHFVVILSPAAMEDTGVIRAEIRFARQQGRTIHVLAGPSQNAKIPWLRGLYIYPLPENVLPERFQTLPRQVLAPVLAPPPPEPYIERQGITTAIQHDLLEAAEATSLSIVSVTGPGGCGKTSLMARLCQSEDIIDAYPAGIFFINRTRTPDVAATILSAISPDTSAQTGPQPLATVSQLLKGRCVLVILDDVWTEDEVGALDKLFDQGCLVVLTRNLAIAAGLRGPTHVLGMFSADEAQKLLPDPEIVRLLHNWPLAISLARTAWQNAQSRSLPTDKALAQIREQVERHGSIAFDRDDGDRTQSTAKSIELTLSQLQHWERKKLELLAEVSAHLHVSRDEFLKAWSASAPVTGEPKRPLTALEVDKLAQRLNELGLIDIDRTTRSLSVHDLIADYLASKGIIGERTVRTAARISSGEDRQTNQDVEQARRILAGVDIPFDDVLSLAKRLKNARYFSYARQLFARARRRPESKDRPLFLAQQHALCTYKDPDLPQATRYERALEILGEVEDLRSTTNQETLGLAGAIYKYKWASDGQQSNLERSLGFYLRGYDQGVEKDYGYTAVNAAFVLDQLAFQEDGAPDSSSAQSAFTRSRREQARVIRREIVNRLPPLKAAPGHEWLSETWWFVVTLAESYFGLEDFDSARYWLKEALATEVADWEWESTARQLSRLTLLQHGGVMPPDDSQALRTLRMFLGNDLNALRSIAIGKVGLALSGGGFRASLFHIGVLARLAELDVLRYLDVLSCVSGGSIVGAQYYLQVRDLLARKPDSEIKREDYIELVKRLEADFLKGVQNNLRTRLAANPWINIKSFFLPHYTRTDRLGELFAKTLFARIPGDGPELLNELLIRPKDAPDKFAPKLDNWHRAAKVPILILNATTLNTGHNWQFTVTWMGEPPASVGREVDGNDLLRRMYYWEAPPGHRAIRLGQAVAASACVPGLFDPVEFENLYPKRTIRLVDGGVHDNQGIAGLLEQECSVLLISDASGQASSQNHPAAGPFGVPMRASSILGARLREAEYLDLDARQRSSQIKNLMFIHLKKDLDAEPVAWVNATDPYDESGDTLPLQHRGAFTSYGVLKTVQERLAAIRTDLDSFSDAEAFSLMLSGYRMVDREFNRCLPGFPVTKGQESNWRFLSIEKAMDRAKDFEDAHEDLMAMLKAGASRGFKIWRLSRGLQTFAIGSALIMAAWITFLAWQSRAISAGFFGVLTLIVSAFVVLPALQWWVFRAFGVKKPFAQLMSGLFLALPGWILARVHLWFFDPVFLAWGRVDSGLFARRNAARFSMVPLVLMLLAINMLGLFNPFTLAYLAQARGDFQAARNHWSRILSYIDAPGAYAARAWANRELGSYSAAVNDYGRALDRGANPQKIYRDRAYTYLKTGNYAAALADYKRLPAEVLNTSIQAEMQFAQSKLNPPLPQQSQTPLLPTLKPAARFVILYLTDTKKDVATRIGGLLGNIADPKNITVRPYLSTEMNFKFLTPVELHYFRNDDRAAAESVLEYLKQNHIPAGARYMPVSNRLPDEYLEVWLSQ